MLEDTIRLVGMIFEIIIFIILAIKIYRAQKNLLNQLYCVSFLSWAALIGCDAIIRYIGTISEYFFLCANILRDIQMIFGFITAFSIFFSSQIISHGRLGVKENPKTVIIVLIICIIAGILLLFFDNLIITDLNGTELENPVWGNPESLQVNPNTTIQSSILLLFPLVLYGYATFLLIGFALKQENKEKKTKMALLIIGNSLIAVGLIYTIIIRNIAWQNVTSILIGHIIFSLSPVFIWMSKIQNKKE
ncbi:MAG: hypothetical protein GY870_19720 [archaeon]|nr:hypothetical protein [archaeon]